MSLFGGTGFGAPSSSPFGQTQQTSVFGQPQQPAFGAAPAPAFGAASAPAFGTSTLGVTSGTSFGFGAAPATPNPFGAASSPAPFGAAPAASSSPFGGSSLFGQQSAPAFGATATPAFGASGGGLFGQASQPAFGAQQASSPFGKPAGTAFGASPGFGAGGFGAGAQPVAQRGTRAVPFRKVTEQDGPPTGPKTTVHLNSITCMPEYAGKSFEELRWEDYQDGVKGGPGVGATPGGSIFGTTASPGATGFGASTGTPAFGSTPSPFGTPGSGFGAAASAPLFGAAATAPAFGASPGFGNAQPGAFGAASAPAFGAASTPAFGAASAPAFGGFGATSMPSFGAPATTPAFGGFGAATSAPAFGATTSAPAFGGFAAPASSAAAFSASPAPSFGAAAPGGSLFGAPATGGMSATPAFGAPASSASLFGASPAPAFGASPAGGSLFGAATPAPASAPAFGGSLFGGASAGALGAATSAPAFSFSAAPPASSAPAFGAPAAATGSLFGTPNAGAPSTPGTSLFGGAPASAAAGGGFSLGGATGGSLFGGAAASGTTGFNLGGLGTPQQAPAPGQSPLGLGTGALQATQPGALQLFGGAPAGAPSAQQSGAGPASPYGTLPALPTLQPAAVGLTQQQRGDVGGTGGSPAAGGGWNALMGSPGAGAAVPNVAALALPRTLRPRGSGWRLGAAARGVSMLGPRGRGTEGAGAAAGTPSNGAATGTPAKGMFAVAVATPPRPSPLPGGAGAGSASNGPATPGSGNGGIFTPRDDPRRLFIRGALPSTSAAGSLSLSPATLGSDAGDGGPVNTPARAAATTPTPPPTTSSKHGDAVLRDVPLSRVDDAPVSNGDAGDESLRAVLPKLDRPEYYCIPSVSNLACMAREDGTDALGEVTDFSVGRRGVGSVRWLEPVDLRGVDLDACVSITRGSVEVYLDGPDKPPPGRGLNRPAEVTLLGVHKLERATGKPTTDPGAQEAFTRKLRRVAAEQGARFVSYDPATGTWRFAVEHFSRYGLPADSDEEGEQDDGVDDDHRLPDDDGILDGNVSAGHPARRTVGRLGLRQDLDADDPDSPPPDSATAAWDSGVGPDFGGAPSLQTELPARLGAIAGEDMQRIGLGLFGGPGRGPTSTPGTGLSSGVTRAPAAHRFWGGVPLLPTAPASMETTTTVSADVAMLMSAVESGEPAPWPTTAPQGFPLGRRRNAWVKAVPALLPTKTASPAAPSRRSALGPAPVVPGPVRLTVGEASMRQALPQAVGMPVTPSARAAGAVAAGGASDGATALGRSWGAGWGPGGMLALPGGRVDSAAHVLVVQGAGPPSEYAEAAAPAWKALLGIHLRHSVCDEDEPDNGGDGGSGGPPGTLSPSGVKGDPLAATAWSPAWRLSCPRAGRLRLLTAEFLGVCAGAAMDATATEKKGRRVSTEWRRGAAHQAAAWELLHLLFSELDGERASSGREQAGDDDASDSVIKLDPPSGVVVGQVLHDGEDDSQPGDAASGGSSAGFVVVDDDRVGGKTGNQDPGSSPSGSMLSYDGEGGNTETSGGDGMDLVVLHRPGSGGDAALQEAFDASPACPRLVDFRRRGDVGAWLAARAAPAAAIELAALHASGARGADAAPRAAMALLSCAAWAEAAAAAASGGDVRLATLLAQAGSGVGATTDAAAQRDVWRAAGFESHIDGDRAALYSVLAGDVRAAAARLDWRRAFGMYLWYACPPDAPLRTAVEAYADAVSAGDAPPPTAPGFGGISGAAPRHDGLATLVSAGRSPPAGAAPPPPATDVAWELLNLHVAWRDNSSEGPLSAAPVSPATALLRRLARPAGWGADARDGIPGWLALTTLRGAGVLADENTAFLAALRGAADSVIAQLTAVDAPEWAVYAAACLPEQSDRTCRVRELLNRHAQAWEHASNRAFLVDTLRVPADWVAAARAQRLAASAAPDHDALLDLLIEARRWQHAHDVFCSHVAPELALAAAAVGPRSSKNDDAARAGERLRSLLAAMRPAAELVAGWEAGAHVYAAHLRLRKVFGALAVSTRDDGGAAGLAERRAACAAHADGLAAAFAVWGTAAGTASAGRARPETTGFGHAAHAAALRRRAALSGMAGELSAWVLRDGDAGGALPSGAAALLAARVPGLAGLRGAAAVQFAAATLAREQSAFAA